jgi:hypothetical protein
MAVTVPRNRDAAGACAVIVLKEAAASKAIVSTTRDLEAETRILILLFIGHFSTGYDAICSPVGILSVFVDEAMRQKVE